MNFSKKIKIKTLIDSIIHQASELNLPKENITDAKKLVAYNESGVALELIITQIYEYEIKISKSFYTNIESVAKTLQMGEERYSFLMKLIED